MANVFISYAREDKNAVLELYKSLKSEGFSLWMDVKDLLPGQDWKAEIEKAIHESVAFIACLSSNSVDKEGFVQAELKRALEVADLMPEGVVYIIPVRLDNCKVPNSLSKWHWVDYFEDEEREKLIRAIQLRINITPNKNTSQSISNGQQEEKYFDAGERIKTVRDELRLNTSQFTEILDLASQREYETMENRAKEVPLSLLSKISDVSGIEVEWLKHGMGEKYKIEGIYLRPIEEDLNYCKSLNPKEYFLTLEPKSLHVGLVAQTGNYRYQVLETGISLDFWNWIDELWSIPAFYKFLKALSDPWQDIDGWILNPSDDKKLYNGDIHFLATARKHNKGLLYDILDVDETSGGVLPYSRHYGNWMHKVHEEFKKYLGKEKVNPDGSKQPNSASKTLEDEFEQALKGTYEAARARGYIPSTFLQMIGEHGGRETAKKLLSKSEVQTGLFQLWELGILHESLEAIVIQDKFKALFSEEELIEARRRLDELGYFKKGK